jgi:hypothetical protein
MSATNRWGKVSINFLLWGLIAIWWISIVPKASAQTYDFDEGLEAITKGLISENREILKNKKIAVFGIIESRSGQKWEISSHIEDGIVDELVNNGYRVIERRRIQDVIKKEIKETTDLWFDQARIAQFGKLVGADIIVTGRYVLWGQGMLKISIRAINVADGEIIGAERVKVHTDRIANLLKSEEKKKQVKEARANPEKPVVKPATEERKTTLSINANVSDAKVLVNGKKIGKTPLSDVTVSPGEHKITVEKQGYEPYRKTIRLGKGSSMSLYVDLREAKPDNTTAKIPIRQKLARPKTENRSTLTRGWDIMSDPLSYGEVRWRIIENKTFEVSFQLNGARPNHTYTVGAHFFNPNDLRKNFTVNGFIGYTLGNKATKIAREGNPAYVFGYDFGKLTTDSQGNGSARFIGDIPPGEYALQFTVRIGECFPSKGITSGCGAVYRSGIRFAEKLVTINTQSHNSTLKENDGLVAYYPFNGNANDASGNGNHGTVKGAVLTADRVGNANSAYSFDGVNDVIVMPDSSSLDVVTHFTLAAWVLIKGPNSGYPDQVIISKVGGRNGNNGYQLGMVSPKSHGGKICVAFNSKGESWPANSLCAGNVSLNKWTYIVGVYDHNALKLYIDGILVGLKVIGRKNVVNSQSTLRISGDDNMHAYVNGYIDDIRIYNRSLSDSEIQQLYNEY